MHREQKQTKAVVTSKDATVQTAVIAFPQQQAMVISRWECGVCCGMVPPGPMPASCDSCGKEGSLIHQPDLHQEMTND